MPPEISHCHSSVCSSLPHLFPPSSKLKLDRHLGLKCCVASERMKITQKKLLLVLVVILAILSVLRLVQLAIETSPSSPHPLLPLPRPLCSSHLRKIQGTIQHNGSEAEARALTKKEFSYLSNIISQNAPCNLLVFGLHPQYMALSSINKGGFTLILEDKNPAKLNTVGKNFESGRIYKVEYSIPAREAFKVLKKARREPSCMLGSSSLEASSCLLALTRLPREVYEMDWDVVVVDGPNGGRPDSPGRMGAIYTARMVARSGRGAAHVLVHDVNRMIEKWFSWEFLCEENLASSKGKFWEFKIVNRLNSSTFCPSRTTPTMGIA